MAEPGAPVARPGATARAGSDPVGPDPVGSDPSDADPSDANPSADYLRHRSLILRIAYDITGSWSDAEDVAQQSYLRWVGASGVRNPRAYLARISTNLALDAVARREKQGYPGPFLPEPVATGPGSDQAMALSAEVEVALMVVLGTLTPLERAAFLLHDVFAFSHQEIADMLDRQPAAIRQLTHRARSHIAARRPEPDPPPMPAAQVEQLLVRFLAAANQGDVEALTAYLCSDVVYIGDGGGKRASALRPVHGAEKVARLLAGLAGKVTAQTQIRPVEANRRFALAVYEGDVLDLVLWLIPRDGAIGAAYAVRNPDKLTRLAAHLRAVTPGQPG
ncbi:MAG: sigma factor-like helix-turn-helix DNA-binding protein [Dermatophilaceae bacterium]